MVGPVIPIPKMRKEAMTLIVEAVVVALVLVAQYWSMHYVATTSFAWAWLRVFVAVVADAVVADAVVVAAVGDSVGDDTVVVVVVVVDTDVVVLLVADEMNHAVSVENLMKSAALMLRKSWAFVVVAAAAVSLQCYLLIFVNDPNP